MKLLVYYEPFGDVEEAIKREKSLKRYMRRWKINLIERENPNWVDLYPALLALPGNRIDGASGRMGPRDKPADDRAETAGFRSRSDAPLSDPTAH